MKIVKRIIAHLTSIGVIIYSITLEFNKYDNLEHNLFIIFILPYIISNIAVLSMLISATFFNRPAAVNSSNKMFVVSTLATNLPIIIMLFNFDIMGNVYQPLADAAGLLSVMLIPFYLAAVFSLGRNLSVLPEANKLQTTGIYSISRHPLYFTYICWYILQTMIVQSAIILLCSLIQIILQVIRARSEESLLAQNFPEYPAYKARVGWFPRGWLPKIIAAFKNSG